MIALLVGLLAFALVVQIKSNTGDSQLASARQDDLVRILSDLNAREQRLRAEISELEQTRTQLASGAQGREAALAEARRRADELGILAGTLPAKGEGLRDPAGPGRRADLGRRPCWRRWRNCAAPARRRCRSPAVRAQPCASSRPRTSWTGPRSGRRRDHAHRPVHDHGHRPGLDDADGADDSRRGCRRGGRDGGNVIVDEPGEVTVDALHPPEDLEHARPVS